MPKIDYSTLPVIAEWNAHWSAREVAKQSRSIDKQSALYKAVMDVLTDVGRPRLVLEGGCGLGRWLLHGQDKYQMVGLDYSKVALAALKEYAPSTALACGDVFHLPIRDGAIDRYLSFGVLEHFEGGPLGGLHEAYRVLKPGGKLLITGPGSSVGSLAEPLRRISRSPLVRRLLNKPAIEGESHFFQYRFRPVEMKRFLATAGFRVVQTVYWGNTICDESEFRLAGPGGEGYGEQVRQWVSERNLQGGDVDAAVTEALACRRPVVITDRVNLFDDVTAADAGIVVECSADAIAEGPRRVLDDPELAERLANNGRTFVLEKFTWDAARETLLPVYRSAVAASCGRNGAARA